MPVYKGPRYAERVATHPVELDTDMVSLRKWHKAPAKGTSATTTTRAPQCAPPCPGCRISAKPQKEPLKNRSLPSLNPSDLFFFSHWRKAHSGQSGHT